MGFNTAQKWWMFCFVAAGLLMLCGCSDDNRTVESNPENWDTFYIRDYTYSEGRIFDLAYPGEIGPRDRVERIWVFQESRDLSNPAAETMYLDNGPPDPTNTYDCANILMEEVSYDQFELLYAQDTTRCPVVLVFYSRHSRPVGVRMEITRYDINGSPTGVVDTIGYSGVGVDTLRILRPVMQDNWPVNPAWQLMWRNCYHIPLYIRGEDIELKVFKGVPGTEGEPSCLDYQELDDIAQDPYIMIFGLDQYNNSSDERIPDGKLDCRAEVFRPDWGLIIFPEREPFNSNRRFEDANHIRTDTLAAKVPTLYNFSSVIERMDNSTYYLQIRYRTD